MWTWVAIDPETKLVPSWLVGQRDPADAKAFIADLRSRVMGRFQITTDGHLPYIEAIEAEFGTDVDCAMLIKDYGIVAAGLADRVWTADEIAALLDKPWTPQRVADRTLRIG